MKEFTREIRIRLKNQGKMWGYIVDCDGQNVEVGIALPSENTAYILALKMLLMGMRQYKPTNKNVKQVIKLKESDKKDICQLMEGVFDVKAN